MTESEIFSVAMAYSNLAMTSLQFFIVTCVAVGGWLFTSPRVLKSPRFSWERWLLVGVFASATGTMAVGSVGLMDRVNIAMTVLRGRIAGGAPEEQDLMRALFAAGNRDHIAFAFAAAILIVSLLILMLEPRSDAKEAAK